MNPGKFLGAALIVGTFIVTQAGCEQKEGPVERAGKSVDRAAEKAGDKVEKAGEDIKDAARGEKK